MNTKKTLSVMVLAGAALAIFSAPAAATEASGHPAFAAVSGATAVPVGHAQFCADRPGECRPTMGRERMPLDQARWDELQDVNNHYNTTITAVSDMDLYGVAEFWTYPTSGYGDCEDIALAKRRALIERGWDESTVLMTIARDQNGDGHAVLMVRTDRGDFILDNQTSLIKVWTDTEYHYLKRQSQAHSGQWVDIVDDRAVTAVAGR